MQTKTSRIENWQKRMDSGGKACRKWIMARRSPIDSAGSSPPPTGGCRPACCSSQPRPQGPCANHCSADTNLLAELLQEVPRPPATMCDVTITGMRRAPGGDVRADPTSGLWRRCSGYRPAGGSTAPSFGRRCGRCVPARWAEMRIAMLEKHSGGWRPVGLTLVMWRIGAKAIARAMRPWMLV